MGEMIKEGMQLEKKKENQILEPTVRQYKSQISIKFS